MRIVHFSGEDYTIYVIDGWYGPKSTTGAWFCTCEDTDEIHFCPDPQGLRVAKQQAGEHLFGHLEPKKKAF